MNPKLSFVVFVIGVASLSLLILGAGSAANAQGAGTTTRVSVASDGTEGNDSSSGPSIYKSGVQRKMIRKKKFLPIKGGELLPILKGGIET